MKKILCSISLLGLGSLIFFVWVKPVSHPLKNDHSSANPAHFPAFKAMAVHKEPTPALKVQSPQSDSKRALETFEAIRSIPGARDLVDEIVAFIKKDKSKEFGVERLKPDSHGLVSLNEKSLDVMIKDPEIKKKWNQLVNLIIQNAENKVEK